MYIQGGGPYPLPSGGLKMGVEQREKKKEGLTILDCLKWGGGGGGAVGRGDLQINGGSKTNDVAPPPPQSWKSS